MPAPIELVAIADLVRLNGLRIIPIDIVTTTNAVQTIRIGVLTANGDAISVIDLFLVGMRNEGRMMSRYSTRANAARNATGNGIVAWDTTAATGSTDAAAVPWTGAAGLPTNWTSALALATNNLNLTFNGDTGQTVHWRGWIVAALHGAATP